ncbi:MAG: LPS export ABC transporter periplasmic protein LptC [Paludibacteraceae bacterium]|nr:LPS export ABC transporter periplasmic protein LptC [Paludibacteraceae bacterium]
MSCQKRAVKLRVAAVTDRKLMPVLEAEDVMTIISDSGITRYRIKAAKWLIFDKADTPYWEFPKGIYLEKFNEELEADASVVADYAFYNEQEQRWMLRGNVKALNLEGERFDSPLLFWDQKTERIYSDSSIVITRESSVIKGVGFDSNQSLTQYTIMNPTGVFPLEE